MPTRTAAIAAPEPLLRRGDVVVAGILAAVVVGPAWLGGLAGSPGAETYGHAWVQWWAGQGWPAWPTGTELALHTSRWPVIDPLPTWIFGGLGRVVGPTAAWNLATTLWVALAALGGAAFARALGGVGMVGAIGVALSPIWLGSMASGLTEDGAIGIVAFSLALALRGRWAAAGALAGLAAWCGLYLGWFAGVGLVCIAVRRPAEWRRWLLGGLLAAAVTAPAAGAFSARLGGEGHRNAVVIARPEPRWRVNPWHGSDLASFVTPGRIALDGEILRRHPTFLGYGTLGLALLGGPSLGWLGVAACIAVAPGDNLSWAGQPLGLHNPAVDAFRLLPFASRFNHHARVMLLGQLVLVGLAARGARRFPRIATGLVLVDTVLLSPAELPLPVTPATSPEIYTAIADLPPGPVRVLGERNPQKPLFDQRAHGRRLWLDPNHPEGSKLETGVLVVIGDTSRVRAERGTPDAETADGAAWVLR